MMGEGWTREICSEDRLMCKCSWGVVEFIFFMVLLENGLVGSYNIRWLHQI